MIKRTFTGALAVLLLNACVAQAPQPSATPTRRWKHRLSQKQLRKQSPKQLREQRALPQSIRPSLS